MGPIKDNNIEQPSIEKENQDQLTEINKNIEAIDGLPNKDYYS